METSLTKVICHMYLEISDEYMIWPAS